MRRRTSDSRQCLQSKIQDSIFDTQKTMGKPANGRRPPTGFPSPSTSHPTETGFTKPIQIQVPEQDQSQQSPTRSRSRARTPTIGNKTTAGPKERLSAISRQSVLAEAAQEFLPRCCKSTAPQEQVFQSLYFPTLLAAVCRGKPETRPATLRPHTSDAQL
ncbi:hypothetical protein HPB50_003706 [Hyalomma asiaticum]|uniref:Uncharacterized protein n=1 Tax=Hyalomma asiaticum TaxID=266040 RepID=A0ACB7SGD7_HYAAI|nr:hypothetical protein HPB50_003706 [Hyalomma asiaticum]